MNTLLLLADAATPGLDLTGIGAIIASIVALVQPTLNMVNQAKTKEALQAMIREECINANKPLVGQIGDIQRRLEALETRRRADR